MEERQAKMSFNKAGNGYLTPKVTLPINWVREMNLDPEDREIILRFEDGCITIQKVSDEIE